MAKVTLEEWGRKLERQIIDATNAAAEELAKDMSDLTPRDTGRAAEGYYVVKATASTPAHIKNDVPYIMVLNDGNLTHEPHAMIQRAIQMFPRNLNRFLK